MTDSADSMLHRAPAATNGRALPPHAIAFYDAYVARDADRLGTVLHDDVKLQITGPSEQFDFYGPRRGKDEVIDLIVRIMPCYFLIAGFDFEHVLVQGGRIATYGQVSARQRDTGRSIRFRFAHFLHFIDGKLIDYRVIADTFDTAQQLVGHSIDVSREMPSAPLAPMDDYSDV
jgi:ketosteroid isomerase-like protein